MRTMTLAVVFSVVCLLPGAGIAQPPYSVQIEAGISPRMNPADVASLVEAVHGNSLVSGGSSRGAAPIAPFVPQILSLHCLPGSQAHKAEARLPSFDFPRHSMVWFVKARGTFVNYRTPPGVPAQIRHTGFYVIDDATGKVLAWGGYAPSNPGSDAQAPVSTGP